MNDKLLNYDSSTTFNQPEHEQRKDQADGVYKENLRISGERVF